MYGKVQETPQNEATPFYPRSPYAISKLFAYWTTINYREAYGIFACNGILFNHESPKRGETFVSKKISIGLAKIKLGLEDCLYLGNLDSKRDWGHAKDYVEMQWLILQQKYPDDYVIATGKQYTVRDFVNIAAKYLGMDIRWSGKGKREKGIYKGKIIIKIDSRYFRPAEVDTLLGDSSKARKKLKWKPKISFEMMVKEMVENELKKLT
jgi:GDPmannose 4,6-dehydratase